MSPSATTPTWVIPSLRTPLSVPTPISSDIVLDDSLIGSDTVIRGETRTLNIGDNTDIDLG
jgi:hypothetical protein